MKSKDLKLFLTQQDKDEYLVFKSAQNKKEVKIE
jgi:hypothetical protein